MLHLLVQGCSKKQIAQQLQIVEETIARPRRPSFGALSGQSITPLREFFTQTTRV